MSTAARPAPRGIAARNPQASPSIFQRLQQIQLTGGDPNKISRKDLITILRNLTTLVSNGVSLSHALDALCEDDSFKKQRVVLQRLHSGVKNGENLSDVMKQFPATFSEVMRYQVQIGERSGTLTKTLDRIVTQLESSAGLRSFIIKKLTYPTILLTAGMGSVVFMMLYVIPSFESMYKESGATLPAITQFFITASSIMQNYWLVILIGVGALVSSVYTAFKNPTTRTWLDCNLLKAPGLGIWLRRIAVLQFVETLNDLMECGFTLAEAIPYASRSVSNRSIRSQIEKITVEIRQGEQFSAAMERQENLFPMVVKRLVIVGEKTGRLGKVTGEIRKHLRCDVEKTTNAMLGMLEPMMTAALACVVGSILLAIYLPMFDMIGKTN